MNQLLEEGLRRELASSGRVALREALHQALDRLRERRRAGRQDGPLEEVGPRFWSEVEAFLAVVPALGIQRVINATGVVLHTGLGRAPWPREAMAAAVAASRYALLEIDPSSGERGVRGRPVSARLCALTGAEAALAVNNNAGAVLLALSALARGRKVVLSRGEMVEIGGSYRLPGVVEAAGARLVEVGTTNRTHPEDYERALEDPETACVLKAHPSNFRQEGFTRSVSVEELKGLCSRRAVPLVYDLGSGVLAEPLPGWMKGEPAVRQALRAGADLVTFSGDKLLGGPQAGLIVGAAPLVERLARDVLARCLRLDKTILAALEATLALHALGEEAVRRRVPAAAMLAHSEADLRPRAEALAKKLEAVAGSRATVAVTACEGRVGSGACPVAPLFGAGVALEPSAIRAGDLARRLRLGRPAVFARIRDGRLILDLRCVSEGEETGLIGAVETALAEE